MRPRRLALTGPRAAALYGLDGYRDLEWPAHWCAPAATTAPPGVLRTRAWEPPDIIDDIDVAPPRLVLRHLALFDTPQPDRIATVDRVELAVEHALRDKLIVPGDLVIRGAHSPGDKALAEVRRRRSNEPATESYAETRAAQLLRRMGRRAWRQVPLMHGRRLLHRIDFVLPSDSRRSRPDQLVPADGLLVEIDGREYHEPAFERDHERQSNYDALGYHWVSFTPTQVEHHSHRVEAAIAGAMKRLNAHYGSSRRTPRRENPPKRRESRRRVF